MELRRAGLADAEAIIETVVISFDGYRAIAPPGWEPPSDDEAIRATLADPDTWALLAIDGELVAGHVAVTRARTQPPEPREEIPGLAHVWHLFVRPPWWGTGLSTELLARAVDEARRRGYERMRLFTPARQARARRFYEREGWTVTGESPPMGLAGLELVEYRREL
jgi:GNAT superfamily N-acetyltransferase